MWETEQKQGESEAVAAPEAQAEEAGGTLTEGLEPPAGAEEELAELL